MTPAALQVSLQKRGIFNKKDMLPITQDLVKLQNFCDRMIKEYSETLLKNKCYQFWRKLANITLCKVQLFNFRRGNECSKMLKIKYDKSADRRQCNEEIFKCLDKVERELAKRYITFLYPTMFAKNEYCINVQYVGPCFWSYDNSIAYKHIAHCCNIFFIVHL